MCGDGWRQMNGGAACCDLCGAAAAVHCAADAAFLCAGCDAKVHGANILASRHLRSLVAGGFPAKLEEVCHHDSATSSPVSSSSCVSTADSSSTSAAPALRTHGRHRPRGSKKRGRGEMILEGWAKRMGLSTTAARRCAGTAGRALRGVAAAARVPLRVAMAAALWHEVAASGAGGADTLQRLEACAHVPARIVVALASSMGRARETRRAAVEGWDECA